MLKEYMARGKYIYPPEAAIRLITDTFEYSPGGVPEWNTISITGLPHAREGLLAGPGGRLHARRRHRLRGGGARSRARRRRLRARRLSFFFNGHNNLLEEVAKFRAARRIWAKIMGERFGAKTERARALNSTARRRA